MGKLKRKTAATPANISRSSLCKITRRQRLAARKTEREAMALEQAVEEVSRLLSEIANDPNMTIIT